MDPKHLKHIISFDGAKIYYDFRKFDNKNPCIIFLHGLGGNLAAWDKIRRFFHDRNISTLAIDLRGHGYSERSNKKEFYSLENSARDVWEILSKESVIDFIVVGHCFGGMVALTFEKIYPNQSKLLVLVETDYKPPYLINALGKHKSLRKSLNLLTKVIPIIYKHGHPDSERFIGTKDWDFKRIASDLRHTSIKSYLLLSNRLADYNETELLSKINTPTLVIGGAKDSVFPPAVVRELKSKIKNSELNMIPEGNHLVIFNYPNELASLMMNFFRKHTLFLSPRT